MIIVLNLKTNKNLPIRDYKQVKMQEEFDLIHFGMKNFTLSSNHVLPHHQKSL